MSKAQIELPALPKALIDVISAYGMARTDFAVGSPPHLDAWQAVLIGIKEFAISAVTADRARQVVGEPVAWLNTKHNIAESSARMLSQLGDLPSIQSSPAFKAGELVPLYLAASPAPQVEQAIKPPEAFAALKAAFAADPDYAWSWHCAVWAGAHDEGMETGAANRAAARFMHTAFDVDTSKNPNFNADHLAAPVAQPATEAEQAEAPVYMTPEDCMRIIRAHAPDDLRGMEAAFRANTFATQPTASNAGEREDWQRAIDRAKENYWMFSPERVEDLIRAALASKPPAGEQKPVGFMSAQQLPLIADPGAEGGVYIPMRKTPAGLLTLALYLGPQPEQVAQDSGPEVLDGAFWRWLYTVCPPGISDPLRAAWFASDDFRAARARGEGGPKG